MTYAELVRAITAILPNATFDEDIYGQIIICTDLQEKRHGEPLVQATED